MPAVMWRVNIPCASILSLFVVMSVSPVQAQTAAKPPAQTKTPPKAAPKAPARPAARPPAPAPAVPAAAAKPAEPLPPPPVAQDLHMKTVYTTGPQKTESVLYRKGERERYEFGDVVLLRQHDLKRTVQIMKAANTYMVIPDGGIPGGLPVPQTAAPETSPQKPGVVMVTTTIMDTGERKTAFGLQARHVKTTIDKQPAPGACDPAKQHIEMDGWYVDLATPGVERRTFSFERRGLQISNVTHMQ